MGKAYANRKAENLRPDNDFYQTPSCMIIELLESGVFPYHPSINEQLKWTVKIFDPCCGKYRIGNVLRNYGYTNIIEKDLIYGYDFLKDDSDEECGIIIMNPPFKLFNRFVEKAKKKAKYVFSIGKMNYFGAHDRNVNGLWNNLEWALPFDRQISFDKPEINGKVQCGMMISAWFIWNKDYKGLPQIKVLDMQKYIAKKGEC